MDFISWMQERHQIYIRRQEGKLWPWTEDKILQTYKFTNVYRELDRTTLWMRENWVNEQSQEPLDQILFNTAFFRFFGTLEFARAHGWVTEYRPEETMALANERLKNKERVFTGAYIVPNMGIRAPKTEVVCKFILEPLWRNRHHLIDVALEYNTLRGLHKELRRYSGLGGDGFMAYEIVSDLRWTRLLCTATDILVWANPGPGARRGLNRIFRKDKDKKGVGTQYMDEMSWLLAQAFNECGNMPLLEMREIEHSLCEWDKYQRVLNGEGRPRSLYHPPKRGG